MSAKVKCDVCGKVSGNDIAGSECTTSECEGIFVMPEEQLIPVEFKIELDEEQLRAIAEQMVELDGKEDTLKMEQRKVVNEWKSKVESVITQRKILSKQYKDRERVDVAMCYPEYLYSEGMTLMIDAETGDERSRREMTKEERQMSIV